MPLANLIATLPLPEQWQHVVISAYLPVSPLIGPHFTPYGVNCRHFLNTTQCQSTQETQLERKNRVYDSYKNIFPAILLIYCTCYLYNCI